MDAQAHQRSVPLAAPRVLADATVLAEIPALAERYQAGDLTPPEYAARYVLTWQQARYGARLAQRRTRADAKPDGVRWLTELDGLSADARRAKLADLLERYDLREVSRRVNIALVGWLRGEWPLVLCERIPSVADVLQMQTRGSRPVTVIADYPRLCAPILDKADGLAFVCHDLEHAWQFLRDPAAHAAQRGFAQHLARAIEGGVFAPYLHDADFAGKFDYLAADMNTHVAHSVQYLRAILIEYHLRVEGKDPRAMLSPGARAQLDFCLSHVTGALVGESVEPAHSSL